MTAHRFFIGTHASADLPSICKCEADFDKMTFSTLYTMQGISDPTYLDSLRKGVLYALGKADGSGAVFSLVEDEAVPGLRISSSLPSGGQGPCHICADPRGEFLLCANYGSGSPALFDLCRDGRIRSMCDHRQYSGTGFDAEDRQKGPHAHFAAFCAETDEVLVCDLGLDTVHVYELDRSGKKLRDTGRDLHLPAGAGPRHLAFHDTHPGRLYVLTEMANTIFVFEYSEAPQSGGHRGGEYRCVQEISAVPSGQGGRAACAPDPALMLPPTADNGSIGCAIRFTRDGKYLFVSSRLGYQSISAFRCLPDGSLRFCSRCLCGGITPRDFHVFADSSPDGKEPCRFDYILTANQDSDLITALSFDRASEELSLLDMKMQAVKPTCILPV